MALTGSNNYYEDFTPGDVYRHARGKTIMEYDNVATTLQVMNTAEGHFNEDLMSKSGAIFPHRV
ncbi:MAG TPA: MaoC family dehydratase, partial [Alphaproteobacteria bacterium]|nr:MaoC family dehydratase [Alphaproteobacteria bacterium]